MWVASLLVMHPNLVFYVCFVTNNPHDRSTTCTQDPVGSNALWEAMRYGKQCIMGSTRHFIFEKVQNHCANYGLYDVIIKQNNRLAVGNSY